MTWDTISLLHNPIQTRDDTMTAVFKWAKTTWCVEPTKAWWGFNLWWLIHVIISKNCGNRTLFTKIKHYITTVPNSWHFCVFVRFLPIPQNKLQYQLRNFNIKPVKFHSSACISCDLSSLLSLDNAVATHPKSWELICLYGSSKVYYYFIYVSLVCV